MTWKKILNFALNAIKFKFGLGVGLGLGLGLGLELGFCAVTFFIVKK